MSEKIIDEEFAELRREIERVALKSFLTRTPLPRIDEMIEHSYILKRIAIQFKLLIKIKSLNVAKPENKNIIELLSDHDLLINGDLVWESTPGRSKRPIYDIDRLSPSSDVLRSTLDRKSKTPKEEKIDLSRFSFPFDVDRVYVFDRDVYDNDPEKDAVWRVVGRMKRDGQTVFFFIYAYHDFTGFDCRGSVNLYASRSKPAVFEHYDASIKTDKKVE
jgi:hypothetical protein